MEGWTERETEAVRQFLVKRKRNRQREKRKKGKKE